MLSEVWLARTPFRTFWGIPLLGVQDLPTNSIQGIAMGLLWQGAPPQHDSLNEMKLDIHRSSHPPRRPLYRRPGFPSWSWAGWGGAVDYNLLKQYFGVKENNLGHSLSLESRSFIRVAAIDGEQKTFEELWQRDAQTDVLTEASPILHVDAVVFQFHLHQRPGSWNSLFICACPAGPRSTGPLRDL
jgi:hypothetical protein